MQSAKLGIDEGETCNRYGCDGVIAYTKPDNCSCHLSAPCHACTSVYRHCPECEWEEDCVYPLNDHIVVSDRKTGVAKSWELRKLDPTKLDWHSFSHSNSSMVKEGVYPSSMTRVEVEKAVAGTFGGRFDSFGNGKFRYIAYTD